MPKVKFGDLVKEVKNKVDRSNNPYEFYVAGDHMDTEDLRIHRKGCFATDDVGPAFIREFKKGQILYGSRRTYLKKVAVADFDGVTANTTFVLESKDNNVLLQSLLPFVMLSDGFTKWSISKSKGSTNPYVLFSDLASYEFELPDINAQRRLSELLWAGNALKESYRRSIAASDDLLKSRFMEMFSPLLKDAARCQSIEQICSTFIDGDWIESKDQSEDGIRLVQTGNVGNGIYLDKGERARFISAETFKRLNCTEVFAGDILVSRLPDPIGRACILPNGLGKAITAVDCTIVRLNKEVLPEYFVTYTLTPFYTSQISEATTGSTRQRISRKNLGKISIPVPEMTQQKQLVNLVHQLDKSKFALKQAIADLDRTIKGIINQALEE